MRTRIWDAESSRSLPAIRLPTPTQTDSDGRLHCVSASANDLAPRLVHRDDRRGTEHEHDEAGRCEQHWGCVLWIWDRDRLLDGWEDEQDTDGERGYRQHELHDDPEVSEQPP